MSATTRRKLTDEERAERRRADREYARQAAEQLRSSEGWQRWLGTPPALSQLLAREPAADRDGPADRDPGRGVSQVARARLRGQPRRAGDQDLGAVPTEPQAARALEARRRRSRPAAADLLQARARYSRRTRSRRCRRPQSRRRSSRRSTSSRATTSRDVIPKLDALAGEIGCTVQERAAPRQRARLLRARHAAGSRSTQSCRPTRRSRPAATSSRTR